MKKRILIPALSLALLLSSCGIKQAQLDEASARLEKLSTAGLPDSLLIDAKMGLFEAKKAKKDNLNKVVKENYELAIIALDKAEAVLAKTLSDKKPVVEQKFNDLKESAKEELSGMHLTAMDTLFDSTATLIAKDWIIDAENQLIVGDSLFESLKEQQKKANKLRRRIVGTWKYDVQITNSTDKTVNANEQKIFSFYKNGKAKFIEQKKGKSGPALKEDWRFESYGTWEMKGDTVHLKTSRFACTKQNFWELHKRGSKMVWEKKTQPTYDSTITDGSQNRHIAYSDLLEDFKK